MSLSAPSITARNPSPRRSLRQALISAQKSEQTDVEAQHHVGSGESALPKGSGPAVLLGVAFLWGTYGPVLKMLYSLPGPPDPAALTAARGVIQAASLWATGLVMGQPIRKQHSEDTPKSSSQRPGPLVWTAGIEMGFWNFLATSLQATGLERTTAVRAAFIIQATAILTPVLAALTGERPRPTVWAGCAVALASACLFSLDGSKTVEQLPTSAGLLTLGDAAVLGAAFFYSVATVRLGFYARQLPALSVAAAKSYALTAWALVWLLWIALGRQQAGQQVAPLWGGIDQPFAWLLVVWSALGPGALAAFLQTKGQSSVPPSQAQVYYSSTPVWSALLAIQLLEGERMGPLGWLGGAGIVLAGLIASR